MLADLPYTHPDRNRPLTGCFYRVNSTKAWREIMPSFRIAGLSYNDLGYVWTELCEFDWNKGESE